MAKGKNGARRGRPPKAAKNGDGGSAGAPRKAAATGDAEQQGPTDREIRDFSERAAAQHEEHKRLQEKARKANALYRATLKDAKKAGIEPSDIIWWIDARGRDPAEIDAETRRRNRVARANKLPIGTQLGLFEDGTTVASAVERDAGNASTSAARNQLQKEALAAGREAGRAGKNRTSNPWPLKSEAFKAFDDGWCEGQAELAETLRPGTDNGRAALSAFN